MVWFCFQGVRSHTHRKPTDENELHFKFPSNKFYLFRVLLESMCQWIYNIDFNERQPGYFMISYILEALEDLYGSEFAILFSARPIHNGRVLDSDWPGWVQLPTVSCKILWPDCKLACLCRPSHELGTWWNKIANECAQAAL